MKKALKYIALFLLAALIIIQLFRPEKNRKEGEAVYHISKAYATPDDVTVILKKACNDCHSNNTRYPWYANIQPAAWWMNNHIKEGKREINFDEYISRSLRYQYKKMDDVIEQIKDNEMPLQSYTWIHKDAILTEVEKNTLINWANTIRNTMEANYPKDSLERKK
jgi:hypothetical protein